MSDDNLFSSHWHRVKDVKPYLAADVNIVRQVFRGNSSWVLQRRATNEFHRLDVATFELVDLLDGKLTIGEIWERALVERSDFAPTQDQWLNVLASLQAAELLVVDRRVAADQLFERREDKRARKQRERWQNPLFIRFALHDPESWLTHLTPFARALFSKPVFLMWVALVLAGMLSVMLSATSIAAELASSGFPSPRFALMLLLVYPPLKMLHELGHALAIKRCGGEVHEIGMVLMVLVPLPYVDASASAAFAEKRDRMLVASAGILVELGFAAVGAVIWATAGGLIAEVGLALLLVGGFSTVLINGNPLLRFDGYYLFADAVEIPNLSVRARRAALAKLQSLLTGRTLPAPVTTDAGELRWLLGYGVASAIYRTGLMLWIAWWLSGQFLIFGVALAIFAVVTSVAMPAYRGFSAVLKDSTLRSTRSVMLVSGLPLMFTALVLWLPLPHAQMAQGVIWLPDNAIVRAASGCEITQTTIHPGQTVHAGEKLFDCVDPELSIRERELLARVDEVDARMSGLSISNPAEYQRLSAERHSYQSTLIDLRERINDSFHVAQLDGRFDAPGVTSLQGRALLRGEIAGFVVPESLRTVRVALDPASAGKLETQLRRVELFTGFLSEGENVHESTIISRTLRASFEVPSAALSTTGGGDFLADPAGNGLQLLEPVINVELTWPDDAGSVPVGTHVAVRFVHPPTPLGGRMADAIRRAFSERKQA